MAKVFGRLKFNKDLLTYLVPMLAAFFIVMAVTIWGWSSAKHTLKHEESEALSRYSNEIKNAISERMQTYREILRGGSALYSASNKVERNEWKKYVNTYKLDTTYPGIQGIGFTQILKPQDVASHEKSIRQEGFKNYSINPKGKRSVYSSIIFIEPFSAQNQKVLGYDMYSDPVRRNAMDEARDTGEASLSGKVILRQDINIKNPPFGFLLYFPVYKKDHPTNTMQERRKAIQGFVYAPFRANDLLENIIKNRKNNNVAFSIQDSDKNSSQLLFITANYNSLSKEISNTREVSTLQLDNQTWTMDFITTSKLLSDSQLKRPVGILIAGIAFSILFSGLVLAALLARTQTLAVAKQQEVQFAKDELLSLASHQLRTPATGVKQYIGLLLEGYMGQIPKDQNQILKKAYESNERQLQIINQLLYVAHADMGRITLSKAPLSVNKLLREVAREQKASMKSRKQTLVMDLTRKRPIISADPHFFRMAVENLISNASKYTPEKGQIKIASRQTQSKVKIIISDTGVGISKSQLPKLFQKFSRLTNELSTKVGGSGIGLYFTRHIVSLHGGQINVQSQKNIGSTFTIEIPNDAPPKSNVKNKNNTK